MDDYQFKDVDPETIETLKQYYRDKITLELVRDLRCGLISNDEFNDMLYWINK